MWKSSHYFLLFVFMYFFASSYQAQAFSVFECSELENKKTMQPYNIKLISYIQQASQDFLYYKNTLQIPQKCEQSTQEEEKALSKKEELETLKNIWKNTEKKSFTQNDFIFSLKGTYMNNCRQNDTYQIQDFLARVQKEILISFDTCINPSAYKRIYEETLEIMKYIRDYDKDNPTHKDSPLLKYWDQDLYAEDSKVCATESWAEVTRAYCRVTQNLKNIANSSPSWTAIMSSINSETKNAEAQKIRKEQKAKARKEAEKYVSKGIQLPFLRIQPSQNKQTNRNEANNKTKQYNENTQANIDTQHNINSPAYTQNLLDTFSKEQELMKGNIQAIDITNMLSDLEYNYSKSFAAQLSLEHNIHSITKSIQAMNGNTPGGNNAQTFPKFLKALYKIENNKQPYQCRLYDKETAVFQK